MIEAHRFGLRAEIEQIAPFIENLPKDESVRRFERLSEWKANSADQRRAGITLTLAIANFLAGEADFQLLLEELDRLGEETRDGRFDARNELQRDMEFGLFTYQYNLSRATRGTYAERYRLFSELGELPAASEEEFSLSDEHIAEAKRAGFEAAVLLKFLQDFRSGTRRLIVVVGNDRYGMRLTVPSARHFEKGRGADGPSSSNAFPREFVRELSEQMPHVVIVDGRSPRLPHGFMSLSRSQTSYAN